MSCLRSFARTGACSSLLSKPLLITTYRSIPKRLFATTPLRCFRIIGRLNSQHFQPSRIPKDNINVKKINHDRLNKAIIDSIQNQVIKDPNEGINFTNFIFYLSNVIIFTIVSYNVFKVYNKGEEVFIPVIISRLVEDQTAHYKDDVVFQNEIRYQLLKKLSQSEKIWNQFKLPIFLSENCTDFQVTLKELNYSIKGYKIRGLTEDDYSNFKKLSFWSQIFKVKVTRDTKPLKLNHMMEPLTSIPMINPKENSLRDLKLEVLAQFDITDNLNNSGQIIVKGELNNDHMRSWKFTKCHLIRMNNEDKKERIVLWELP